ncbi:SAR2788 family putative toxin [Anoxybacillus eryuanensis]|uniref:SAR2788 family putative toxin n=1 Tax=Anoxybacillus eryuanensis TaxID=651866 RepID=UPI003EF40510
MFKFKRVISIPLTLILLIGIIPVSSNVLADEITDTSTQTGVVNEENITVVQNNEKTLEIQSEVSTDIDNVIEGTSDVATDATDDGHATVSLSMDKDTREFTVKSVETDSEGNQVEKEYKVDVQQATEYGIVATFTDMNTGEKYEINTNELHASFAFLIPIAVVVGEALLEHLIALGLAFVIAGVTYTLASEIVPTLRNKNYDHYAAYLKTKEGVYIGNPISLSEAISRLNGKDFETNNVWSKTSGLAKKVAKEAGGGREPVFDSPHGSYPKFLPHFHKWNRSGGHSFYSY